MQKKYYAASIIVSAMISSCMGHNHTTDNNNYQYLNQKNIHQVSNITYLTKSNLDLFSKDCYSIVHYYDQLPKITLSINDSGDVGGSIMALEHIGDNQNTCTPHFYKWGASGFVSTQFSNTEIDCSNRSECMLLNVKLNNNNAYTGRIIAPMSDGSYFSSDGIHINLEQYQTYNSPSIFFGIHMDYDPSISNINEYNRVTMQDNFIKKYDNPVYGGDTKINDNNLLILRLSDKDYEHNPSRNQFVIYDVHTKEEHIYKGAKLDNNEYSTIQLKSLSNNNNCVSGIEYKNKTLGTIDINQVLNLIQISPIASYNMQKISSFPFDIVNTELTPIQIVNDGTLLLDYKKYSLDGDLQIQITNRKFLYSSTTNKYYDLNSLLNSLGVAQYAQQITEIQMSENSNYILFVLDKNGKTATIAIKASFPEGINKFLKDNLQPL